MELVLATRNQHKVTEITGMLADFGIQVRSLAEFPCAPEVIEDGTTYEENALKKARSAAAFTGKPSLADDTGLEVDALDGQPGVHAARYAGEHCNFEDNIRKLLAALKGVPKERRAARFVCVMALVMPDGREELVRGELEGRITEEPAGAGGFGYDPVFFSLQAKKTLAELTADEKNRISHRRRALDLARDLFKRETIGA
ncbi:MAG TPA: XTP/dITP diphosphatase [Nitrospirales bacterium]